MDKIRSMMDEQLASQFEALKDIQAGTDEQTTAIDNLATLYKVRVESDKALNDAKKIKVEGAKVKIELQKAENESKKLQIEADRAQVEVDRLQLDARRVEIEAEKAANDVRKYEADREDQRIGQLIHTGVALVEIGLPLVCYGHWFRKGLKFEETGSITSSMMRNLLNKFKTKK